MFLQNANDRFFITAIAQLMWQTWWDISYYVVNEVFCFVGFIVPRCFDFWASLYKPSLMALKGKFGPKLKFDML